MVPLEIGGDEINLFDHRPFILGEEILRVLNTVVGAIGTQVLAEGDMEIQARMVKPGGDGREIRFHLQGPRPSGHSFLQKWFPKELAWQHYNPQFCVAMLRLPNVCDYFCNILDMEKE